MTFAQFADNPGNFAAQGVASGFKIKMSDNRMYPVSKTFYYNSVLPKQVVSRFYSSPENMKHYVGII